MRYVTISLVFLVVLVTPVLSADTSPKPRITDIHGEAKGGKAKVHFTLRNAFSPEMVEALKSGIEISFKTIVRVRRHHRNWFDMTIGEITFSRSVRYDVFSRVYRLNRGKEVDLLPDIFTALAGMTRYEIVVPLTSPVTPGKRYKALVRTRLDKVGLSEPLRSILFFSSIWDVETEWAIGAIAAP
ncbi:MAG: DUF4390 domain-containing protein [Deltaproteobacteria bacterium]|nr:DUF4390 domain-containing protein [Deltaproteobacteria bacterium]